MQLRALRSSTFDLRSKPTKPYMAIPDGVSVGTVRRALCNPYWAPAWDVPGLSVSSSG